VVKVARTGSGSPIGIALSDAQCEVIGQALSWIRSDADSCIKFVRETFLLSPQQREMLQVDV
jgi:hypothetical protein